MFSWTKEKTIHLKICCVLCYLLTPTPILYLQVVALKTHHNRQQAQNLPTLGTFYWPLSVYVCIYRSTKCVKWTHEIDVRSARHWMYPGFASKTEDNKYIGTIRKTTSTTVHYSHTKFLQTHTLVVAYMCIAKILATTVPSWGQPVYFSLAVHSNKYST
jgi:hypothetical protein